MIPTQKVLVDLSLLGGGSAVFLQQVPEKLKFQKLKISQSQLLNSNR